MRISYECARKATAMVGPTVGNPLEADELIDETTFFDLRGELILVLELIQAMRDEFWPDVAA